MIIFDASYLIPYLHPAPQPPMDRVQKPVARFRERINYLIAELNAGGELIGVPTPALAEILVRAGKGKYKYLATIGDAYRFEVLPFDQLAAIDASELIQSIKNDANQPLATWAKVKFDIQIAAIGKAVGATTIYSDDADIEAHGKRLKIPVIRICDLPLPPDEEAKKPSSSVANTQSAQPQFVFPSSEPTPNDQTQAESENRSPANDQNDDAESKAASSDTAPIRGTDGGRTEGEAPSEDAQKVTEDVKQKPCECGCGAYPKDPKSRFLPGHDLKKAYGDQKQPPPSA